MNDLIKIINETFPPKERGGFNGAVFFHHAPDGKLKTCSPLVSSGSEAPVDVQTLVKRLLEYSDACKSMANDIENKTLNKN